MTERERWIVYPLLFLALGAALRDKLIDRTTTKSIVCQELLVVDEQPLGREPVLLAKIGRTERTSAGAPSAGQLVINGQLEVVDRDPIANQLVRSLVKIGRTEPTAGAASSGFVFVNGQIVVNGAINAAQYAYQGIPFAPALQAVLPGISLPDLMRAWQQTMQNRQKENAASPQSSEKNPAGPSPPPPLAEPAENR